MAIVDNRNVSLEGRKIGVHPVVTLILIAVLLVLMTVPTYHMMNALGSVFNPSSLLAYCIIGVIAFSVSTVEPMLSQSIYHNEGTSNNARKDIAGRFWLILCVIFVTAMGGWSHDVTTSKQDIATTSHNTKSQTFADDLKTIELEYQSGMIKAKTDAEHLALDIERRKARSELNNRYSQHQANATSEYSPIGRLGSALLYCLFSLIVSVATITYSRFILRFSLSITEIPIIDYISKLGQDWTTGKAEGSNNIIDHGTGRKTQLRNDLPEPEMQLKNIELTRPSGSQKTEPVPDQNHPTQNRPAPATTGVGAVSDTSTAVGVRTPNKTPQKGGNFRAFEKLDYEQLKMAVIAGKIPPTVRPVKDWLLKNNLCLTDADRQKIAADSLHRLSADGVLVLNPEQGTTNRIVAKYVLADSVKKKQGEITPEPEVITADEIGPNEIETRCGQCGNYDYTPVDQLIDRQKGIVKCSECQKGYVAETHVTNDSKPIKQAMIDSGMIPKPSSKPQITPAAGVGIGIDEDGISPMLGVGAVITK